MDLKARLWLVWCVVTIAGAAALLAAMVSHGHQWPFLIGETTVGHHQIELACKACHITPFGGTAALQQSCMNCHGEELRRADDAHPAKKFNDPRNADRLEKINAQLCISCHREHKPEQTHAMGVTVPNDVCVLCHAAIGEERESHEGLAFTSCTDAGCHNFHDNRALYEDFLVKHLDEPDVKTAPIRSVALLPHTGVTASIKNAYTDDSAPLSEKSADAPQAKRTDTILAEWTKDAHARNGVNCSDCHEINTGTASATQWVDQPGIAICRDCHALEADTFTNGRHGMRLSQTIPELGPMRPGQARLPMKASAHDRELGCNSCHGAHGFNTAKAPVEACLDCHDDEHSRAYRGTPHHDLWVAERQGRAEKGTGVSCATCHMPRGVAENAEGKERLFVNHNQNDNLRPNEKMVRSVCGQCHGLQFTLDALADRALIRRNFDRPPTANVKSLEWARKRMKDE